MNAYNNENFRDIPIINQMKKYGKILPKGAYSEYFYFMDELIKKKEKNVIITTKVK